VITRGTKVGDEVQTIAQGAVGMAVFAGEPGNFKYMTQEFSFNGKTVTNAPYSAEEKTESVQTLADGNRIVNVTTTKVYRDSQGRTRREMTLPGFGGDQPHTLITISDPVAGANYTLDTQNRVAHEMPMPSIIEGKLRAEAETKMRAEMKTRTSSAPATFIRRAPAPNVKHEDLTDDLIEGVSVKGTRETSTIDAGAMGNEKPITIVSERWYSPELQIEVKSIHDDPRMGKTTHTLANIVRAEPDAALFQVPSEFNKDEGKGGVQIRRFDVHSIEQ
jgi:hypothetical protein